MVSMVIAVSPRVPFNLHGCGDKPARERVCNTWRHGEATCCRSVHLDTFTRYSFEARNGVLMSGWVGLELTATLANISNWLVYDSRAFCMLYGGIRATRGLTVHIHFLG